MILFLPNRLVFKGRLSPLLRVTHESFVRFSFLSISPSLFQCCFSPILRVHERLVSRVMTRAVDRDSWQLADSIRASCISSSAFESTWLHSSRPAKEIRDKPAKYQVDTRFKRLCMVTWKSEARRGWNPLGLIGYFCKILEEYCIYLKRSCKSKRILLTRIFILKEFLLIDFCSKKWYWYFSVLYHAQRLLKFLDQ